MILLQVTYQLYKKEEAKDYVETLKASGLCDLCRQEAGNLRYDYFYPADCGEQVFLVELWRDEEALEFHKNTEHFKQIGQLKERFVKSTDVKRFSVEELK